MTREEEIQKAIDLEFDGKDKSDYIMQTREYKKGILWADSHPSLEVVERIINLAFDGWDSIEDFRSLAKSIKGEIEGEGSKYFKESRQLDPSKQYENYEPFDLVVYKPTRERGLVKRVIENGVFVLFRIQSTAQLCKFKDLEKE